VRRGRNRLDRRALPAHPLGLGEPSLGGRAMPRLPCPTRWLSPSRVRRRALSSLRRPTHFLRLSPRGVGQPLARDAPRGVLANTPACDADSTRLELPGCLRGTSSSAPSIPAVSRTSHRSAPAPGNAGSASPKEHRGARASDQPPHAGADERPEPHFTADRFIQPQPPMHVQVVDAARPSSEPCAGSVRYCARPQRDDLVIG
jgi:hypothetical protein